MRTRSSQSGIRFAGGVSIALAAALCAWTSNADAGCSHYVVVKAESARIAHRLLIFEIGGGDDGSNAAPARPKPCSGAFCSGKPGAPAPAPITIDLSEEALAVERPAPPSSFATGRFRAFADGIVRAVIAGPALERPPR